MRIAFYSLGCKVNHSEIESFKRLFAKSGFDVVPGDGSADIYIINSCTVTARSDSKTRQLIRRTRRKEEHAVIVLTGCFASVVAKEELYELGVDLVVLNSQKSQLFQIVLDQTASLKKRTGAEKHVPKTHKPNLKTRAMVKIQDGCDRSCAYCIIPRARGKSQSKSIDEIKAEVQELAKAGFVEIVVTGVNLSLFKRGAESLEDVIAFICDFPSIKRVRLGSLEPEAITDSLVWKLKKQNKFCPHFHISLQSGCNKILKAMNRRYSTDDFREAVNVLKTSFEDVSITTDVIAGFPGEDDCDFEESLEFVKLLEFSKIHVFPYSKRPGTAAQMMAGQISKDCKTRRVRAMAEVSKLAQLQFMQKLQGSEQEVLFEKRTKDGNFKGFTPNYAEVKVNSDFDLSGKICKVKILTTDGLSCVGSLM